MSANKCNLEESYDYNLGDGLIKDLKSIGVITLKAYYIENLREVRSNRKYIEKKQTGVGPIPEKALKGQALTHWAGYVPLVFIKPILILDTG